MTLAVSAGLGLISSIVGAQTVINATLGSAPPTGSNYTASSGTQTGRLLRNGTASTCAAPKTNPGLNDTDPGRAYHAYTFTNTASSAVCFTVTLTQPGNTLFVLAYGNAGLVTSAPDTNYLADAGSSTATATFSFNVPAGESFTLAVHEVAAGGGGGTAYTLSVNLPSADLAITKTDGVTTAVPGGSVTYTVTASNAGPGSANGATVADTFPAALTCTWTCAGAGGGTCTASGSGNINDTVNLPTGGSVSYTASCAISASATGTLSNTATVSPPAGVVDPNPANNSATDTDTLTPSADLAVTKTDGVTTVTAGTSTTYTITASNAGPSNALGATVADTFPASLTCTWTCVGVGGGSCTASGSGNINNNVNLPAGGSVTYTATCGIAATATGSLSNTATVTAPGSVVDPNPANNSATDTDTIIAATYTIGGTISGLSASGLVLAAGTSPNQTASPASGASSFAFPTAASGSYAVTVQTQPSGLNCSVANGSGTLTANVTNVAVTCSAITFTVTGIANPSAGGTVNCVSPVNFGGSSSCNASANAGYVFSSFSGGCVGSTCAISNIQANQSVTANFLLTQTITFGTQTPRALIAGGSFLLNPVATASSALPLAYSSLTPSVCTVSGTTVTMFTAGTCTVRADQAGNAQFASAFATQSFVIGAAAAATQVPSLPVGWVIALALLLIAAGVIVQRAKRT